jgi:hypothetical protein
MNGDIFLATGLIEPEVLFKNGLHQNSLTLYNLFETLGYTCYCIVEKAGNFVPGYRFLEPEDYVRSPASYRPRVYIEIGLSLDTGWREFLRKKGCKTVKLYLGNILNIDTETVCWLSDMNFPHHNAGGLDIIWTSPHYDMNLSYALALNRLDRGCLVPYVWDSQWVKGLKHWSGVAVATPNATWTQTDIIIMEPNISFQKCSLFPILLVKAFAQTYPEWTGRLIVQNSDRLFMSPWFRERIMPQLNGMKVVWKGRQTLGEILAENPSAAFISHQLTNDYNYLILELMHLDYPVLHNSERWSAFGYSWSVGRWPEALITLRGMLEGHSLSLSAYRVQANQLAWIHSPQNPMNLTTWKKLLM